LQFKGCLASKEIIGIFTTKDKAEKVAKMTSLKSGSVKNLKIKFIGANLLPALR
jgi:hypothetical protein